MPAKERGVGCPFLLVNGLRCAPSSEVVDERDGDRDAPLGKRVGARIEDAGQPETRQPIGDRARAAALTAANITGFIDQPVRSLKKTSSM